MKIKKKCNKNGFSIVELLVVIVIMGTLAAIGVPKIFGLVEKTKRASDVVVSKAIERILEQMVVAGEINFDGLNGGNGGVFVVVCKDSKSCPGGYAGKSSKLSESVYVGADKGISYNGAVSPNWDQKIESLHKAIAPCFSSGMNSYSGGFKTEANGIGGWDWYVTEYYYVGKDQRGYTRTFSGEKSKDSGITSVANGSSNIEKFMSGKR